MRISRLILLFLCAMAQWEPIAVDVMRTRTHAYTYIYMYIPIYKCEANNEICQTMHSTTNYRQIYQALDRYVTKNIFLVIDMHGESSEKIQK